MDNYFYTSIESIPDSNLESIRFKNYVDYDDYLKMSDSIKVNILEIIKRLDYSEKYRVVISSIAHHLILDLYKICKSALDFEITKKFDLTIKDDSKNFSIFNYISDENNEIKPEVFFNYGDNNYFSKKQKIKALSFGNYLRFLETKIRLNCKKNLYNFHNQSGLLSNYLHLNEISPIFLRPDKWPLFKWKDFMFSDLILDIKVILNKILILLDVRSQIRGKAEEVINFLILPKLNYAKNFYEICQTINIEKCGGENLIGGSPQILGKILNHFYQRCGKKVMRFAHGGDRVFFSDYYWGISELTSCDEYFVHSSGEKKSLEFKLKKKLVFKNDESSISIKTIGSKKHQDIYSYFLTNSNKKKSIVFVPGAYLGEKIMALPEFKVPDILVADYQMYLVRILKDLGYHISIKIHPGGLNKLDFFKKLGCNLVLEPFNIFNSSSSVLIFDFAGSAFFDSLASNKGIIFLNTKVRPKFNETFADLKKRCCVVDSFIDERKRIRFHKKDLSLAIQRALDFRRCSHNFAQKYFFN